MLSRILGEFIRLNLHDRSRCCLLSGAVAIKNVVDEVLQTKDMMMLNLVVAAILLVFLIRGFATYGQTYTMSYIGQRVIIDIREALFKHLQRLDQACFDRRKTGVIMSNLTNDVGAFANCHRR